MVNTTMRIDLPEPLESGETFQFSLDWEYAINDSKLIRGRTGYEFFEEDGNYLYEMAHWFPRLCAYTDYTGWQNKEFLGRGEFTLEFGDYEVSITVPDDHVVASTGVLQNPDDVLKPLWKERLALAETAEEPVLIVTREEAEANEGTAPTGKKTWTFAAENVRDFVGVVPQVHLGRQAPRSRGRPRVAMSFWPKEGTSSALLHPLGHPHARRLRQVHLPLPLPGRHQVNGPVGGMEYPMIVSRPARRRTGRTRRGRSRAHLRDHPRGRATGSR